MDRLGKRVMIVEHHSSPFVMLMVMSRVTPVSMVIFFFNRTDARLSEGRKLNQGWSSASSV